MTNARDGAAVTVDGDAGAGDTEPKRLAQGAAARHVRSDAGWMTFTERLIVIFNLVALVGGLLIVFDFRSPLRPWLATVLFLFGPGSGLVQLVGRFDIAVRWILMVALSIACSLLTAELLLSTGQLRSGLGAIVLTAITATGAMGWRRTLRPRRSRR